MFGYEVDALLLIWLVGAVWMFKYTKGKGDLLTRIGCSLLWPTVGPFLAIMHGDL